jgi:archaellum component FlaF (FlaF/FlaG flagellin family)
MGYSFMIFGILLIITVVTFTAVSYGIAKDGLIAPFKAKSIYAEREAGKLQTDFVVVATKVNGTMKYTYPDGTGPEELNLYLTVKNNGSVILYPMKYSVILNRTWVWINSSSDEATSPMATSEISSLNLNQKPLSLLLASEYGVKIIVPTAPRITQMDLSVNTSNTCYYNLDIAWDPSYGEVWPITHYAVYYTNSSDMPQKNEALVGLTTGPDTTYFIGNAFRKPGGGNKCEGESGESRLYVWITAFDTHGNEGVPSNTCGRSVGGGTLACG